MPRPFQQARRQLPGRQTRDWTPSVSTFIPGRHNVWQLRTCGTPSMVTLHSKQIPIPQRGPAAHGLVDRRNCCSPARRTATATVAPAETAID